MTVIVCSWYNSTLCVTVIKTLFKGMWWKGGGGGTIQHAGSLAGLKQARLCEAAGFDVNEVQWLSGAHLHSLHLR